MKNYLYKSLKSKVSIKIIGTNIERFIKRLKNNNIEVLNLKYLKKGIIIKIYEKDYDKYNRIIKDGNDNIIAIGIMTTHRNKKSDTIDEYDYDGIIGKYKSNLEKVEVVTYGDENDDFFTDLILDDNNYLVVGYSSYEDGSYLSKFINYSSALKVLEVE